MGCDIHLYVEIKQDGKWVWWKDQTIEEDEGHTYVEWKKQIYTGRNYDLFAVLADVRNGRGFAGIDTGDAYIPISTPRGVPHDATEEFEKIVKSWDMDGHSHSYLSLLELISTDEYWNQGTKKRGWVSMSEYVKFQAEGEPSSYSGGVHGASIQHVSNEEMDALLDKGIRDKSFEQGFGGEYYTQVEWGKTYRESSYIDEIIRPLNGLAEEYGVTKEEIRIVFFFDN